jgi:hypothetical protein
MEGKPYTVRSTCIRGRGLFLVEMLTLILPLNALLSILGNCVLEGRDAGNANSNGME